MEEYFLNLYIQISPSPKRLNSSLTWIVLCPGGTYKAGGEEQATPGERSIKAKETFWKIWILLWIIIYDTDTTSRDVGTDTWNLYELHWMTTWVESSYVGEKCKIEEEKIIPNQPHLFPTRNETLVVPNMDTVSVWSQIQETRDFDLVALGPPSKVLQEEQGLEVSGILSFQGPFNPFLMNIFWEQLLKTSGKLLPGIGNHFSAEIQLSPRFPPPCKPYLLWKQTCWSSSSWL